MKKAVNNGTIGYDGRQISLLNRITCFLDNVNINPKAQDTFLIYCQHHRLESGSNVIIVDHSPYEPLPMINVVYSYQMTLACNTPTWLIYLLKDAMSPGLFEDPKQVLTRLCNFFGGAF